MGNTRLCFAHLTVHHFDASIIPYMTVVSALCMTVMSVSVSYMTVMSASCMTVMRVSWMPHPLWHCRKQISHVSHEHAVTHLNESYLTGKQMVDVTSYI